MKISKLLLAVVGASAFFAAFASSASARNLSTSSQTLRASFREVIFEGAFGTTNCQLTLEGSLHSRTIAKVAGTLIGHITRARLGPCSSGTATINQETLPWHVRYLGFTGTLPNIATLVTNVIGASWRIREAFGVSCRATSTVFEPVIGTYQLTGSWISGLRIGGSILTGGECFGLTGSFSSSQGRVTVLNSTFTVNVTLI